MSSQAEADSAIASAREHAKRYNKPRASGEEGSAGESDSEDEHEYEAPSVTDSLIEDGTTASSEVIDPVTGQQSSPKPKTTVAEDVIQRKGVYGRFAEKWFSKKGWSADSRRTQGLSSQENLAAKDTPKNVDSLPKDEENRPTSPLAKDALPSNDQNVPEDVSPQDIPKALEGQKDSNTIALLPKILQTTKLYFSSGNFFFSYDYDLSHAIGDQHPNTNLPLFKQFDPLVSPSDIQMMTACC